MELTFEQIRTVTEKYAPVMTQLDRLSEGMKLGSPEYFDLLSKMKLAVSDQFVKEVNELKSQQMAQPPVQAMNSGE